MNDKNEPSATFSACLDGQFMPLDPTGYGELAAIGCSVRCLPRYTRADKKKYDGKATRLVGMFKKNFRKYTLNVTADVANVM